MGPEDSLGELSELARSAGALPVGTQVQRLNKPSQTYLGKGKISELVTMCDKLRATTVICDDELTPNQQKNLEQNLLDIKVIDRTALILDVFARGARSKEGRLQVELAQHEYILPRIAGQWSHLERLGGGIGTRGPGETQIETDRRLIRNKITKIRRSLSNVSQQRGLYQSRRRQNNIPIVSLVGYTNAGKSTLLNCITGAGVVAENRMFSTLDPLTRKVVGPNGSEFLLTDTVGLIQKLPTTVIAAFSATLQELNESFLIVHVVDITHPNAGQQVEVVYKTLADLGLQDKPLILALNKSDLLDQQGLNATGFGVNDSLLTERGAVMISAASGVGVKKLLDVIALKMDEGDSLG